MEFEICNIISTLSKIWSVHVVMIFPCHTPKKMIEHLIYKEEYFFRENLKKFD